MFDDPDRKYPYHNDQIPGSSPRLSAAVDLSIATKPCKSYRDNQAVVWLEKRVLRLNPLDLQYPYKLQRSCIHR